MALQEIFEQYGIWGVLVLVVGQFVFTQIQGQRARLKMEEQAEQRLNERHTYIVQMLETQAKRAEVQNTLLLADIDAARKRIDELEDAGKAAAAQIEALQTTLKRTTDELGAARVEAEKVPAMKAQIERLQEQVNVIRAALLQEKDLRDKAEERVHNLEVWNTRANADNALLINRVNELERANALLKEQVVVLEQALIEMAGTDDASDDRRSDATIHPARVDSTPVDTGGGDVQRSDGGGDADSSQREPQND